MTDENTAALAPVEKGPDENMPQAPDSPVESADNMLVQADKPMTPAEVKKDEADQKALAIPSHAVYRGLSEKSFDEAAQSALQAEIDPEDVELRPDGIVYYPEIKYRRRLNDAFGAGGWALMPRHNKFMVQNNTMMRPYALYVHGRFVSEAIGEMDYIPSNARMTYGQTSEGVKSNALMRCCKDLGIASELWDPVFIRKWIAEHAVKVFVSGKNKPQWRRADSQPFWNETGIAPNSPNQDKYNGQNNGGGNYQQRGGGSSGQVINGNATQTQTRPAQQAPAPQAANGYQKPNVTQTEMDCENCVATTRNPVGKLKLVEGKNKDTGKPYKFVVCDEKEGGCGFRSFHTNNAEHRAQEALERNIDVSTINV